MSSVTPIVGWENGDRSSHVGDDRDEDRFLLRAFIERAGRFPMVDIRISHVSHVLLFGALASSLSCSTSAAGDDPSVDRTTDITACTVANAGGAWTNQAFLSQSGSFVAEFTATPDAAPIDAVVGFSAGRASRFPDLAAIVRFNPAGVIDVRAGSAYQADVSYPYMARTAYHFRFQIDVVAHVYSVEVQNLTGWTSLARGYAFRSEQAEVEALANLATKIDSSSGSTQLCDLQVAAIDVSGCPVAEAGGGFITQSIGQPGEVIVSSDFVVKPDRLLDGVIGLSMAPAAGFSDLAATVRLAPSGVIDARNGAAYQADTTLPYFIDQGNRIRIIANLPTHTFSVYVARGDRDSVQLAHGYAFRPSQSTAGWLGQLNEIVDSPEGQFSICNAQHAISIGVRMFREGNYAVVPLSSNNEALISDGTTTLRVSSSGQTLAQLGAGGEISVDPAGNVYLARIAGTSLVVDAYSPSFAHRWTRSYPAGADQRVLAIGADAASVVAATGSASGVDLVKRWLTNGTESTTLSGPMGDAIAIGAQGFAIGSAMNGTVVVTKWRFGQGLPEWQRSWQNSARITAMALAPSGNVYFGGTFSAPISFGGPTLEPSTGDGPGNAYVAALTAVGEHAFTRDIHQWGVRGIASNGSITAVSALTGPRQPRLVTLDAQGEPITGPYGRTVFGGWGSTGATAVGPSGRVYWNFADAWPTPVAPAYPYLISLDPGV